MEMNNTLLKYTNFTLIEIVIAIAILAIGVTSVMSLFPVTLHHTKNSIAQNYSALEAENIFAFLSREAYTDWSILNSIPGSIPSSKFNKDSISTWTKLEADLYDDSDTTDGRYGIKVQTNDVTDMTGEILLWKSQLTDVPETGDIQPYSKAAAIYMEISWPLEATYAKRKKNYYYMELKQKDL